MTQLTARDAADRVGVSRQTIFKAIKLGKLSATVDARGQKQIDVSELLRVYGRLQSPDDSPRDKRDSGQQSAQSTTTVVLQLELERAKMQLQVKDLELATMRERVDELKARELDAKHREREATEERLRMLGVIEQQNRLLAAPVPAAPAKSAARPRTTTKAPAKALPAPAPAKRAAARKTAPTQPAAKAPAKSAPVAQKTAVKKTSRRA